MLSSIGSFPLLSSVRRSPNLRTPGVRRLPEGSACGCGGAEAAEAGDGAKGMFW